MNSTRSWSQSHAVDGRQRQGNLPSREMMDGSRLAVSPTLLALADERSDGMIGRRYARPLPCPGKRRPMRWSVCSFGLPF
jgi:hypothetical protein